MRSRFGDALELLVLLPAVVGLGLAAVAVEAVREAPRAVATAAASGLLVLIGAGFLAWEGVRR